MFTVWLFSVQLYTSPLPLIVTLTLVDCTLTVMGILPDMLTVKQIGYDVCTPDAVTCSELYNHIRRTMQLLSLCIASITLCCKCAKSHDHLFVQ